MSPEWVDVLMHAEAQLRDIERGSMPRDLDEGIIEDARQKIQRVRTAIARELERDVSKFNAAILECLRVFLRDAILRQDACRPSSSKPELIICYNLVDWLLTCGESPWTGP
jgi:hypothetical protein